MTLEFAQGSKQRARHHRTEYLSVNAAVFLLVCFSSFGENRRPGSTAAKTEGRVSTEENMAHAQPFHSSAADTADTTYSCCRILKQHFGDCTMMKRYALRPFRKPAAVCTTSRNGMCARKVPRRSPRSARLHAGRLNEAPVAIPIPPRHVQGAGCKSAKVHGRRSVFLSLPRQMR